MLTPAETVAELDKYIIGQAAAKRAVAIALRNRYRRLKLDEALRDEIAPKNIIMMGPTGVGKTEIARRLAKMVDAPFVKVEATKFTEVGYVGRDVDSMIRDLIDVSVRMTSEERRKNVFVNAEKAANERILAILKGETEHGADNGDMEPLHAVLQRFKKRKTEDETEEEMRLAICNDEDLKEKNTQIEADFRNGLLEDTVIEITTKDNHRGSGDPIMALGIDMNMGEVLSGLISSTSMKKVKVKDARRILTDEESEKLIDMDAVVNEAIERAEQSGIIFIDEMDKVAVSNRTGNGHDVSREGVQRDILPVVEGCSVNTKYGIVHTDHILFIAAGAFQMSKVSDLIPELQGRFPIMVELLPLTEEDYKLILTQPQNAAVKQYTALLAADNVFIDFDDESIALIAKYTAEFNESCENIGARRLHAVLEQMLDEVQFTAGENGDNPVKLHITAEYVEKHISNEMRIADPDRYIV